MKKLPPVSDPQWGDKDFRLAQLHGLIALHKLKSDDVADLTGHHTDTVRQWRSGRHKSIPVAVLRALMYDLQDA